MPYDAIFYRDQYILLPEEYPDISSFLSALNEAALPRTVHAVILKEDAGIRGTPCEQGRCMAPYFLSDYLDKPQSVVIENAAQVYPAQVELLDQKTYNARLREMVSGYCPGCRSFGRLTEKDDSLNGHFEEISLNGVCFFRYETRQTPRNFYQGFAYLAGAYDRFIRGSKDTDFLQYELADDFGLVYASGKLETDGEQSVARLSPKKNTWLLTKLSDLVAAYLRALDENYRIELSDRAELDPEAVLKALSPKKIPALRKELKKYGAAIGVLEYDPSEEAAVSYAMQPTEKYLAVPLFSEPGKRYYLFTGGPEALKKLRYLSPVLTGCHARATVYDAFKTVRYTISYDMPGESLDEAPAEAPKKLTKKQLKAQEGMILSREQAAELFHFIGVNLPLGACDHTLRLTLEWIHENLPEDQWEAVVGELHSMGGFCDCEVLLNCYEDYELDER